MPINELLDEIDPDTNCLQDMIAAAKSEYISIDKFKSILSEENALNILSYNIRSLNCNYATSLLPIIDKNPPLAMVLTETWLKDDTNSNVIEGFSAFHTMRTARRSGGVSIYIKSEYNASQLSQFSYVNLDIEVCVVKVEIGGKMLFIIGIYRPHTGTIENFTQELESIIKNSSFKNMHCLITGDFNIDLLNQNTETTKFTSILQSSHYFPVITKPTRFPSNNSATPTALDHIWCNFINIHNSGIVTPNNTNSGIIDWDMTDHCPIFVQLPKQIFGSPNENKFTEIIFRSNNEENRTKFSRLLNEFDWNTVLYDDIHSYFENFFAIINRLYCESFPLKKKIISRQKSLNPWFTSELEVLVKQKSLYFDLLKIGAITKEENNRFKNRVKSNLEKARCSYYKNLLSKNMNNAKSTWKTLNFLMGHSTTSKSIKTIIYNNVEIIENAEIAEIFSEIFYNIPINLNNKISPSSIDPTSYVPNNNYSGLSSFEPCSPDECSKIMVNLNTSKVDLHQVSEKLIVQNCDSLSPIISKMINKCMMHGLFPAELKIALITPIHKKEDKTNPMNYRPISKLPLMSKIFERIIFNRISEYLSINHILSDYQFGFRKDLSTFDAITHFTEMIYRSLNDKMSSLNIMIDYSKAFDTVNVPILLKKLGKYGFNGIALQLIHSYLNNRQQIVLIGNSKSLPKTSSIGVPQGSILGPLLFLIYVNEISCISNNYTPTMFADDCTLSFQHSSISTLLCMCNSDLEKFKAWSDANRLTLNLDKTKCLFISNLYGSLPNHDIHIDDYLIETVSETKFLGVIIDSKMKFKNHIDHICNKVSRSIGILYKIQSIVPRHILKIIYYSIVHPYFIYCLPIFASTYATHLHPLKLLQKKAIRIISGAGYLDHTERLFYSNKILKIDDLHKYHLGCHAYKNPNILNQYVRTHNYNTRNRNDLLPTFQRLRVSDQSVIHNTVLNWNEVPLHIKESPSLASFKYCYRQFLLNQYAS